MNITQKLMLIVLLTLLEVSITLWAAFQISKGATFHQLNFLHLKYNEQFLDQVSLIEQGQGISSEELLATINLVKQQPEECLRLANWLDKQVMKFIGTYYALELCEKDIRDAEYALHTLDKYKADEVTREQLLLTLKKSAGEFFSNSAAFEKPVTKTVEFIFHLFIPMIVFISIFNIAFITYLSRTISGSISKAIGLLSGDSSKTSVSEQIERGLTGELKVLLELALQRLEKDLLNLEKNEKLQQLVNSQTESLMLANQELEQFSYRTSHDLKGPLTRSKRLCSFILEDFNSGRTDSVEVNLPKVIEQMGSLELLVEDLMSLAKADLIELNVERISIEDVLLDIQRRISDLVEENNVTIKQDTSQCQFVYLDKIRITQILENLFSNACKYVDRSKDASFLHFKIEQIECNYVLDIEDNGMGIPHEYRGELFVPFKRFHPNIDSGSGLGLSIVKKHIDKLEGSIEYIPTAVGTKFRIVLPLKNHSNTT